MSVFVTTMFDNSLIYSAAILLAIFVLNTQTVDFHFCRDMNPQNSVDIEQLMGMWFGIEVILHRYEGDARGISLHESCPVVHISEILPKYVTTTTLSSNYYLELSQDTYRKDFNKNIESAKDNIDVYKKMNVMRRLRLLWDEGGDDVEYSLKFNSSRAGFWISSGVYNGSSLENQYNGFAGVIQVIKAVGNHLLLTFCFQLPEPQLYSVLLSREPFLNNQDIQGVHSLLNRIGLSTINIRKVCVNYHHMYRSSANRALSIFNYL